METAPKTSERGELDELLRRALISQYHAALAMLRQAVEQCSDGMWTEGNPAYWRVAYHAAFFTHLYLGRDEAEFEPWEHHRAKAQSLDAPPVAPGVPYSRSQVLEYVTQCDAMVERCVRAMDLTALDPGFSWYQISKVEHQILNVRHIQHHTTHLAGRLRATGSGNVEWIGPM